MKKLGCPAPSHLQPGVFVGDPNSWCQLRVLRGTGTMLRGRDAARSGALGRAPGFQDGLGRAFRLPRRFWMPSSSRASLSPVPNGLTGFAACGLFPCCSIGDCRVVSSAEIAGIADSEQNGAGAVYKNLAQPLKLQSNPPPRLLLLIKHA